MYLKKYHVSTIIKGHILLWDTLYLYTFSGMVAALHVYNYIDARLVYSLTLIVPGVVCLLTPLLAMDGNYVIVALAEFVQCCLTAMLTPMIPSVVRAWFRPSEHYVMSNIIWLGLDTARICFSLSGVIIEAYGWKFMFFNFQHNV